ncbi:MAG: GNAT family N-acetyltransferase [Saccharofermentans sp.]|nr:GNAT family N-acetyltransferase [Saccharofermentans sp.]
MPDVVIRRATIEDAPKIALLTRRAMLSYQEDSGIKGNVLESLTESIESVEERITTGRCLCLYDGDNILGTITITRCPNPMKYSFSRKTEEFLSSFSSCGYISRFAVAVELRKTGLGRKLLDAALSSPETDGTGLVLLHTAIANTRMTNFYLNRGFDLIDTEKSRGYERGLFAFDVPFKESDILE